MTGRIGTDSVYSPFSLLSPVRSIWYYQGSGHVWQRRFKPFPIQQDEHLLTVLSDVETWWQRIAARKREKLLKSRMSAFLRQFPYGSL